jgi:VanZ family protein
MLGFDMRRNRLQPLLAFAAWACIIALAILSLLPAEHMVRTGVNSRLEHVVAYAGSMLVFGAAYGRRFGMAPIVAGLIAYAGTLEVLQLLSPGRHSSVFDWLASSSGVLIGATVLSLVGMAWLRRSRAF